MSVAAGTADPARASRRRVPGRGRTGRRRWGWRWRLSAALWLGVAGPAAGATARGALPGGVPLVFTQEPRQGDGTGTGSRLLRLDAGGHARVLTAGLAAAADPCVSFDGTQVLFAGRRRPEDPWDIWLMDVDGSRLRQLTRGLGDCREPVFLVRAAIDAPEFRHRVRWIGFVSTAPGVSDECGRGPLTSLYATNLDALPGRDRVLWRTTYSLGGDLAPAVVRDGRTVFSSWQRHGYALMATTWAGEELNPVFGSHDGDWSQLDACERAATREVLFIERQGEAGDRSGRLACISWRRPLHSHRVLSRDAGRYRTPQALADGTILVSHAPPGGDFGLYVFDPAAGRPGRRIFDDPDWHDVDPQPVCARPEPTARIPMVAEASVLDVAGNERAGQLQCLDVYDTDRPELAAIPRGAIKAVRLVEGIPRRLRPGAAPVPRPAGDAMDQWPPPGVDTQSLGEAPVEADGSFYVNVPGDVPFYVETLDAAGNVLGTMRAWVWVRTRDQRGCIGCHEDKELAPVNRATEALIKAAPLGLMGTRAPAGGGGR